MGYLFTADSEKLIVTFDTESGVYEENIRNYFEPNLVLGSDRIFLKEDGKYAQDFIFEDIDDIGGAVPENLIDAYNLLDALIKSIFVSGGGGAIPTLQQVTDEGSGTDVQVFLNNGVAIARTGLDNNSSLTVGDENVNFESADNVGTNSSGIVVEPSGTTITTSDNIVASTYIETSSDSVSITAENPDETDFPRSITVSTVDGINITTTEFKAVLNTNPLTAKRNFSFPDKSGVLEVSGSSIPITGTEDGNPVSGDIEFNSADVAEIRSIFVGDKTEVDFFCKLVFNDDGTIALRYGSGAGDISQILSQSNAWVVSNNSPTARGLSGEQDFTPNITNLDYTQKKYVDDNFVPIGSEITLVNGTYGDMVLSNQGDGLRITNDGSQNLVKLDLGNIEIYVTAGGFYGRITSTDLTGNRIQDMIDVSGKIPIIGFSAPLSSTDTGVQGEIRITPDFVFHCYATNLWNRIPAVSVF